jgi:hypothetical protein
MLSDVEYYVNSAIENVKINPTTTVKMQEYHIPVKREVTHCVCLLVDILKHLGV